MSIHVKNTVFQFSQQDLCFTCTFRDGICNIFRVSLIFLLTKVQLISNETVLSFQKSYSCKPIVSRVCLELVQLEMKVLCFFSYWPALWIQPTKWSDNDGNNSTSTSSSFIHRKLWESQLKLSAWSGSKNTSCIPTFQGTEALSGGRRIVQSSWCLLLQNLWGRRVIMLHPTSSMGQEGGLLPPLALAAEGWWGSFICGSSTDVEFALDVPQE